MRKLAIVLPISLALQACGTTNPGDAAGITYQLPKTDAKVVLGIDVLDCHYKNPKEGVKPENWQDVGVRLDSTLKIEPEPGARGKPIRISGADLNSNKIKRSLTVNVDDNGVISSVNSTNTDQRAAIVGNIVKTGVAILGAVGGGANTPVISCNNKTEKAVSNLKSAESALSNLLVDFSPKAKNNLKAAEAQKQINALAELIAGYKLALHRDVPGKVIIDNTWNDGVEKDIVFDADVISELFDIQYASGKKMDEKAMRDAVRSFLGASAKLTRDAPASGGNTKDKEKCDQSIFLPNARFSTLEVTPKGSLLGKKSTEKHFPTSQLYDDSKLCLSTHFGENRTVSLKLNKFGQVTEFGWISDAQLANVTSAMAGVTPDIGSAYEGVRDLDVARDKSELTRLQTEQSLRKARQCQAILDAGGTQCP